MRQVAALLVVLAMLTACHPARAADGPAFAYDDARTAAYLGETPRPGGGPPAAGLRAELARLVDEILAGPWRPLCSDYSAAQAGGVGPPEWCFTRPGEYVLALSQAAPYLDAQRQKRAHEFLRGLVQATPPTRTVSLPTDRGKERNIRRTPPVSLLSLRPEEADRALFGEAYAVWVYADAFAAWDEAAPLFEDLKKLRGKLADRDDFRPHYRPEQAGPLRDADLKNPEYRFRVCQALLAGCQDNYGYKGAREARERMEKGRPVFFPAATLAALFGYHRLAVKFGPVEEADWARKTFATVARHALGDRSSPYLWSDPMLVPEVARLLRDGAGPWLNELARTSNVGDLPAVDWDNWVVPGVRDHVVMNPYTWFHAWGGQGEGVRPRSVLGAYLANARLLPRSPEQVTATLDVPWCRADLYHAVKLTAALQAVEGTKWEPTP